MSDLDDCASMFVRSQSIFVSLFGALVAPRRPRVARSLPLPISVTTNAMQCMRVHCLPWTLNLCEHSLTPTSSMSDLSAARRLEVELLQQKFQHFQHTELQYIGRREAGVLAAGARTVVATVALHTEQWLLSLTMLCCASPLDIAPLSRGPARSAPSCVGAAFC